MEEETNIVNKSHEITKITELLDNYKNRYGNNALNKLLLDLGGFYGLVDAVKREDDKNETITKDTKEVDEVTKTNISEFVPNDIPSQGSEASIYASNPETLEKVREDFITHGTSSNITKDQEVKVPVKVLSPYEGASTASPGQTTYHF